MTLETVDFLREINTATKYPSIATYHEIDKGILKEGTATVFPQGSTVIGTEKVDGTNARIVFLPDGNYLIGSREELLYAGGDLIHNPSQGIVDALRAKADWFVEEWPPMVNNTDSIVTVYGEVYGGKVGAKWKNYTTDPTQVGFRLFDVAVIEDAETMMHSDIEQLSAWREHNRLQRWYNESQIHGVAQMMRVEVTPRITMLDAAFMPSQIAEMDAFLKDALPHTKVALFNKESGASEGMVFRTQDRSVIAKARFEDYAKTLKKMVKA